MARIMHSVSRELDPGILALSTEYRTSVPCFARKDSVIFRTPNSDTSYHPMPPIHNPKNARY